MKKLNNFLLFLQSPAAMFKNLNRMLLIEISAWLRKINEGSVTECAGVQTDR